MQSAYFGKQFLPYLQRVAKSPNNDDVRNDVNLVPEIPTTIE